MRCRQLEAALQAGRARAAALETAAEAAAARNSLLEEERAVLLARCIALPTLHFRIVVVCNKGYH